MLGAIAGDIIGSPFEGRPTKNYNFPLFSRRSTFTDDTVLTVALADSIIHAVPYKKNLKTFARLYPRAGYGMSFSYWVSSNSKHPYNSYGNGSAMRVSPAGWAYDSLKETIHMAGQSAELTHNHPEGMKGARAVAAAIFLARSGHSKTGIKNYIETEFGYNLSRDYEEIKKTYSFDVTCQGSVPEAIIAFLASSGFEDTVRKAVALGGDSDTQACIAGGIAEAFYSGIPEHIGDRVFKILDARLAKITRKFMQTHVKHLHKKFRK
jgi:ADP-ribosylglycohydrolase